MIRYAGGTYQLGLVFHMTGSVFPAASVMAIFPAIVSATYAYLLQTYPDAFPPGTIPDNNEWSLFMTFSWVVGFFLVFRTSQSYSRYWEGAQLLHAVTTEWYDACAQLVGFASSSKGTHAEKLAFYGTLVRLFSLLHCSALQQVTVMDDDRFHVIDLRGLDKDLRQFLKFYDLTGIQEERRQKTEIIFQWITRFTLENINLGIISTPPPIVTRAFQELNSGMTALNRMMTITDTPFPFPYVQMLSTLLIIYMTMAPFIIAPMASHWGLAGLFTFVAVFTQWAINLIASEIEQPFGDDLNDFDLWEAQDEFNGSLLLLVEPVTQACPQANPILHKETHRLSTSGYDDADDDSIGSHDEWEPDPHLASLMQGAPPKAPTSDKQRKTNRWATAKELKESGSSSWASTQPTSKKSREQDDEGDSDDDNAEPTAQKVSDQGHRTSADMSGNKGVNKQTSSGASLNAPMAMMKQTSDVIKKKMTVIKLGSSSNSAPTGRNANRWAHKDAKSFQSASSTDCNQNPESTSVQAGGELEEQEVAVGRFGTDASIVEVHPSVNLGPLRISGKKPENSNTESAAAAAAAATNDDELQVPGSAEFDHDGSSCGSGEDAKPKKGKHKKIGKQVSWTNSGSSSDAVQSPDDAPELVGNDYPDASDAAIGSQEQSQQTRVSQPEEVEEVPAKKTSVAKRASGADIEGTKAKETKHDKQQLNESLKISEKEMEEFQEFQRWKIMKEKQKEELAERERIADMRNEREFVQKQTSNKGGRQSRMSVMAPQNRSSNKGARQSRMSVLNRQRSGGLLGGVISRASSRTSTQGAIHSNVSRNGPGGSRKSVVHGNRKAFDVFNGVSDPNDDEHRMPMESIPSDGHLDPGENEMAVTASASMTNWKPVPRNCHKDELQGHHHHQGNRSANMKRKAKPEKKGSHGMFSNLFH